MALAEATIRHALGRAAAENGAGSVEQPLITGRSNVRHIKGVLPVVYKPRYMDIGTRKADEIMFATGNANKLKEASTLQHAVCNLIGTTCQGWHIRGHVLGVI